MPPTLSSPRPLWSFVEASLDEAEFLWTRWEAALDAHDYTLTEVALWIEQRLHGALDGVRVAGDTAVEPLLQPALTARELGRVSAAAHVLGRLGSAAALDALLAALGSADETNGPALGAGIARVLAPTLLDTLWLQLGRTSAHGRAALLDAFAFARRAPAADFAALLDDREPALAIAAAAALAYVPQPMREGLLLHALGSSLKSVRNAAVRSGVRSGSKICWQRCCELLHAPEPSIGPLLSLGAQLGSSADVACVVTATQAPLLCRDSLWALGFAGTRAAAEACVVAMHEGPHARVAAEAFAAITGVDLSAEGLLSPERATPDKEPDTLADEDLDAELVPTRDSLLPMPNADAVAHWWAGARTRFDDRQRYLNGRAWSWDAVALALRRGPTRRRHALALELCARTAGRLDLQTRAFGSAQQTALLALDGIASGTRHLGSAALGLTPHTER